MCEVLDVSPSGYYSWLTRPPSQRSRYDEVLVRQIRRSFSESGDTYGVRRVWPDLLSWDYPCGRERVARLMRQERLQARQPRRRLPRDSGERPTGILAPNTLERCFDAARPINVGWQTLPISGRVKAGCFWRWCSIYSHAVWWVGQ